MDKAYNHDEMTARPQLLTIIGSGVVYGAISQNFVSLRFEVDLFHVDELEFSLLIHLSSCDNRQ